MKNSNRKIICKKNMEKIAEKIPYVCILLLMVIICPLGVYLFFVRSINTKHNMYNKGRNLIGISLFILFLVGIGIYSKIKEVIQLYDSGMSLDMMNFMPDNIFLYIIGIIMIGSYLYVGKKLIKNARVEQVYTYRINIEHRDSLKKISNELGITIEEVKNNIKLLQQGGYLIPLEIDDKKNKILYNNIENDKPCKNRKKRLKCSKCGTLVMLKKDEYIECDFCGHGMIDEDIRVK